MNIFYPHSCGGTGKGGYSSNPDFRDGIKYPVLKQKGKKTRKNILYRFVVDKNKEEQIKNEAQLIEAKIKKNKQIKKNNKIRSIKDIQDHIRQLDVLIKKATKEENTAKKNAFEKALKLAKNEISIRSKKPQKFLKVKP